MKILQINNVPYGSTGKIMNDIADGLKMDGHESIVCYGRGPQNYDGIRVCSEFYSHVQHFISRLTGYRYGGYYLSTKKIISIIQKNAPDVVHIQCINGNFVNIYRLLDFLSFSKIPTLITLHAEFMYTGSCGHSEECNRWLNGCGNCPRLWDAAESYFFDRTHQSWQLFYKKYHQFTERNLMFIAVSDWVKERAKSSPLIKDFEVRTILNGINTDIFKKLDCQECSKVAKSYGIEGKYIFFVSALFDLNETSLKGGKYILDLAERLKGTEYSLVIAAMFGFDTDQLPKNVKYIGRTKTQEDLAALYNCASASLILSRRETFCMPVAESLSCGTPIAGFKAFGPESIALEQYSKFVEYADVDQLFEGVMEMVRIKEIEGGEIISNKAMQKYSRTRMYKEYLAAYKKVGKRIE